MILNLPKEFHIVKKFHNRMSGYVWLQGVNMNSSSVVDARLAAFESQLALRGVLDVKFFFNPSVSGQPLSETKKSVANVLDAYLEGQHQPMGKIGDANLNEV